VFTTTGLTDPLEAELQGLIRTASDMSERSRQRPPGPSEIGDPCLRRLAHKILDTPPVNLTIDPLPSTDGTAFHEWVRPAVLAHNTRAGRIRFIAEQRVEVRPGLTGTLDVYDSDTYTVIDWKRPGAKPLREYRDNGPGPQYRGQVHLYGLGLTRLGFRVDRVAIAFLPRGGLLSGLYLWAEDYDPARAAAALQRYDNLLCAINDLQLERNPQHWPLIPATPTHCAWCAWWQPNTTDLALGCPGESGADTRPEPNTNPTQQR